MTTNKTGRRRCRLVARPVALVLALASATVLTTSVSASTASVAPGALAMPLTTSISNGSTSWAVVAMGRTDQHNDLFPQLFNYTPSTRRWGLATPPGVADNGGLFIAAGARATLLSGFGASQRLTFSPLALTLNGGRNWEPGLLGKALARVPSAIAVGPGSSDAVLVSSGHGQSVLTRTGSLEQWRTMATSASIAASTSRCALSSLDAIDVTSTGRLLVGATCESPGSLGLFEFSGGTWHEAPAVIPGFLETAAFEVLRLTSSASATEGLFAARKDEGIRIVAGWSSGAKGTWSISAPLQLARRARIVSSGTGPGGTQFVVVSDGTVVHGFVIDAVTRAWQEIGTLPRGTQSLAFEPDGTVDALVVAASTLTVWHRGHPGGRFIETQSIKVPIQYGSSA